MPVQVDVSTEKLLNAVAQMPKGEFDIFISQAKRLREGGNAKKQITTNEADLLHRINTTFSETDRSRYNELYAGFKSGILNTSENKELSLLIEKFEKLNVRRLKMIGQLAKLRGQSVNDVIDHFELTISDNV